MNLQICFVNDSGSDKDSDADDSKTETSLDTPLSPMVCTDVHLQAHAEFLEKFSRMQAWKEILKSLWNMCYDIQNWHYMKVSEYKGLIVCVSEIETEWDWNEWGRYSLWIRFSCCMSVSVFAHVCCPLNQFTGSKWVVNWNTLATAMDEWPH